MRERREGGGGGREEESGGEGGREKETEVSHGTHLNFFLLKTNISITTLSLVSLPLMLHKNIAVMGIHIILTRQFQKFHIELFNHTCSRMQGLTHILLQIINLRKI